MSYTISKDFAFSASHQLDGLPSRHKCGRLHGHNYLVRLEVTGEGLDDVGFVVDYGEMRPFARFLDERLDHKHLNDITPGNPTAEHLARWLAQIATDVLDLEHQQVAVGVAETPRVWAWWRP